MGSKTLVLVSMVFVLGACKSRNASSSQKSISAYTSGGFVDFIYIPINKAGNADRNANSNVVCFAACKSGTSPYDDSRGKSFNLDCNLTGYAEVDKVTLAASNINLSDGAKEKLSQILSSEDTQVDSNDPYYRELLTELLPLLNTDSEKDSYCGQ